MNRGHVRGYTDSGCQPPCDGPAPRFVYHTGQEHNAGVRPHDCQHCGLTVAKLLTQDLHVGVSVSGRPTSSSAPPLQHRDVFVLSSSYLPMSDTAGFVVGLRQGGLPVTVLPSRDPVAAADVATMSLDQVVVALCEDVHGLERKVVVSLLEDPAGGDCGQGGDEWRGRLYAMSRCSGQLVCVMPP